MFHFVIAFANYALASLSPAAFGGIF